MSRRWYYSHNGQNYGPLSAKEIKHLAGTGGLQPDDLLWLAGRSETQAVLASQALDFAGLRRAAQSAHRDTGRAEKPPTPVPTSSPPSTADQLPDWINEVNLLFRDPEQAVGPAPDWLPSVSPPAPMLPPNAPEWLADVQASTQGSSAPPPAPPPPSPSLADPVLPEAGTAPPLAGPVPIPMATPITPVVKPSLPAESSSPGYGLLEQMGIDPVSGKVVDPDRFRSWQQEQEQSQSSLGELPLPSPSDADPFRTARKQLANWFDLEKNVSRLASGNLYGLRHDPVLQEYMKFFEQFGLDKLAHLWEYVEFLIDHRKTAPR